MDYLLPKDLAYQLGVSTATVYNYLKKHKGAIRTRKENGKTHGAFRRLYKLFTRRIKYS